MTVILMVRSMAQDVCSDGTGRQDFIEFSACLVVPQSRGWCYYLGEEVPQKLTTDREVCESVLLCGDSTKVGKRIQK